MSEINRRLEEALTELAEQYAQDVQRLGEHFDRAMARQAEDNERQAGQVKTLLGRINHLQRQVNALTEHVDGLGKDYATLAKLLRGP